MGARGGLFGVNPQKKLRTIVLIFERSLKCTVFIPRMSNAKYTSKNSIQGFYQPKLNFHQEYNMLSLTKDKNYLIISDVM